MPYPLLFSLLLTLIPGSFHSLSPLFKTAPACIPYDAYFAETEKLLLRLRDTPTTANFDAARRAWEKISWLQPLRRQAVETPIIDNNRHWALISTAEYSYAETGVWQSLEIETEQSSPGRASLRLQTEKIISYLRKLKKTLEDQEPAADDIRFLLATEVYRQYTLTLGGHHRINTDRAPADFLAFLSGLKEWDGHFDLFDKTNRVRLLRTINICREAKYTDLDRYTLYRGYLRPLYRSLLQGISPGGLARSYGIAASASGELFSEDFMASVSTSYSPAAAELGKILFFDPLLSGNLRLSCASCHQPSKAYTDGRITSMAFDYPNRIERNATSLINATTGHGAGGVDLAKPSVGHFIQSVFDHPQEMNVQMDTILHRLNQSAGYRDAFTAAFKADVDSASVIMALEAFILSLNSINGSFDQELRSNKVPADSAAIRGYNLFAGKANCGNCHFPPYFDGRKPPFYRKRTYQSAGREIQLTDRGMGDVLQNRYYDFFFRTPGLRNLSYSAPYAHDGYFITLRGFLGDHHKTKLLSPGEIDDLLYFISSLDDSLNFFDVTQIRLPRIDNQTSNDNRRPAGLY